MNILIGKIGRPIFFSPERWGMYAGDEEGPLLYELLARRHPEHTFYLIGRSDFGEVVANLPGNIIDLVGDCPKHLWCSIISYGPGIVLSENIIAVVNGLKDRPRDTWLEVIERDLQAVDDAEQKIKKVLLHNVTNYPDMDFRAGKKSIWYESKAHLWLADEIKRRGLKFDVGIFYLGPSSCTSITGVGLKNIDGEDANPVMMLQNYGAPILHTLNVTGTPYFLLCGDPRYVPWRARDVYNDERFILSQVNTKLPIKRISAYDSPELRGHDLRYEYAGIETIFMLREKKVDFRPITKDVQFTVFLNGKGSFSHDREKIIEQWVLKPRPEVKVYGVWNDAFKARFPGQIEERALSTLTDVAFRTRYTLIPPFTKARSSFVTQKFWKMVYYGIIPFFHPSYDTDKIFNVPDELRVYTSHEMWDRIAELDAHPEKRAALLEHLYGLLEDKYFNGDHLAGVIDRAVARCTGRTL